VNNNLKAKDIMSKDVIVVSEEDTVKQVAKLFVERKIGGAPVMRDEKIVGIVSEDDLIMQDVKLHFPTFIQFLDSFIYLQSMKRFEETLRKAVGARIKDVMSTEIVTAGEEDSIEDIATLMAEKRINRVPIVRDGKLVGMVTKGDIVRAISRT
jgi:CBS domain-containing protein